MLVNEIWDFKSIKMGRELEIAGDFIYDSAKKAMSITGVHNSYEINTILYDGAVGIERLEKIYLCLVAHNPLDESTMPECLKQHNHIKLQNEIEKHVGDSLDKNATSLLDMFNNYYNKFRYSNYSKEVYDKDLRKLFTNFVKKIDKTFNFDEPYATTQFEKFKRFYINELGNLAKYYFQLIKDKANEINVFTYEIESFSTSAKVFWSTQRRTLYDQMILEQNAVKELIIYMCKGKGKSGVFRLLNTVEPLDFDDAMVNDYLEDFCAGRVSDSLIDCVYTFYEEIENKTQLKERTQLLSLIGNTSVCFDYEEDTCDDEE